jgi:Na+/citrate or Na+/malate symporter
MKRHRRTKLLKRTIILILLGILVGGVGGAAIGFITGRTPSAASQ